MLPARNKIEAALLGLNAAAHKALYHEHAGGFFDDLANGATDSYRTPRGAKAKKKASDQKKARKQQRKNH